MGYWIIVSLIVLGGVLVLVAAASVDAKAATQERSAQTEPAGHLSKSRSDQLLQAERQVSLVLFTPQMWLQRCQTFPNLDIPDVATEPRPVRSSMLRDVATAAESQANDLADSVTTILVGADDFLAGHSLEAVLDDLDRLLTYLSNQPAMAVVGSIPDIGPALATGLTRVSEESISATVEIWNNALGDLVESYSAEFVDLSSVPVHLVDVEGKIPGLTLSACPDLPMIAALLAGPCSRAADRIRSVRAET